MTIPPEVVDRIIDYVHDDHKTLGVCLLVARNWVPSARFHLFSKLSILTEDDGAKLKGLISTSPDIPYYCQELTMGIFEAFANSPAPPGFTTFFQPLLTLPRQIDSFTALHTLHIRGFPFPPTDFIEILVALSQKITTIAITDSSFGSRHDLWKILRLFPNLRNVRASNLGYSSSEEGDLAIPPNRCHSPPIVSFSFYTHCMGFVLEKLAEPPYPLTHLKSLEIKHTDQHQERLNSIAIKYRDVITTLKFGANSTIGSDIPPHIGMYTCLQTLILGKLELFAAYPLRHRPTPAVQSFAWVTAAIEHINSRLNRLVFEIAATQRRDLNAVHWEDIDASLDSREPFGDLKFVDVVFLDTIPTTVTLELEKLRPGIDLRVDMAKRMRRTVERGLMRFSTRGLRTCEVLEFEARAKTLLSVQPRFDLENIHKTYEEGEAVIEVLG